VATPVDRSGGTLIAIRGLSKTYHLRGRTDVQAIADITCEVAHGEFVALVGPSGCGKTTLLKVLAGLLTPSGGTFLFDGQPLTGPRSDFGIVFQNPVLPAWRSVLDNVLLPIDILRRDRRAYRPRAIELLKLVNLEGFHDRYPFELSGGMQQRVSLCRALIHDPSVLLMDEPFGALDAMTREEMNDELLRIWEETRKTVLFITHSISEAVYLADRVLVLSARPSRVKADVPVPLPRPRRLGMRFGPEFSGAVMRIRDVLGLKSA
jgi:NitT/TauT family transport system ATP-binding protein